MTTVQAEKIACRKLSLLQLVPELGDVSKACRILGYSHQQFYEIRWSFQLHGAEGLLDRPLASRGLTRTAFRRRLKRRSWRTGWSTPHTGSSDPQTN